MPNSLMGIPGAGSYIGSLGGQQLMDPGSFAFPTTQYAAPTQQQQAPIYQNSAPNYGLPNYQSIYNQAQNLTAGSPNVGTVFKQMSPAAQQSSFQQGGAPSSQPNTAQQIIQGLQSTQQPGAYYPQYQQPSALQYNQQVQSAEEQAAVQALKNNQTPTIYTYAPGETSSYASANPLKSLADQQYTSFMQSIGGTPLPGGGYAGAGGTPGQNIPAMNRMLQEINASNNPDLFNYLYNAPISMFNQ